MPSHVTWQIQTWAEIQKTGQWKTLLLGNGASIAVTGGRFAYPPLFEAAKSSGLIRKSQRIFDELKTNDFERVLRACWYAKHVCKALGIADGQLSESSDEVRHALIETVRNVHPSQGDISGLHLDAAGTFASAFDRVAILNYDLSFYWAFMRFNEAPGNDRKFEDAFRSGEFVPNTIHNTACMVFYPHGALFFAKDIYGKEWKINASPGADLLTQITGKWEKEDYRPLFVCEGDHTQKLASIRRSSYLSKIYDDILPTVGNTVIYGLSFENDQHIVDAIKKGPVPKIAISVFSSLSDQQQQAYCNRVWTQLRAAMPNVEISFFRSDSPGCWCNPTDAAAVQQAGV